MDKRDEVMEMMAEALEEIIEPPPQRWGLISATSLLDNARNVLAHYRSYKEGK